MQGDRTPLRGLAIAAPNTSVARAILITLTVCIAGCPEDNPKHCDTNEQCVQKVADGVYTDGDDGDGTIPAKLKAFCHPDKHYCYAGCVVDADCQDTSRRMNEGQAAKSRCNTTTHHCEAPGTSDSGPEDAGPNDLRSDLANGEACSDPAECTSGNCVDSVCCDSACEGTCVSCALAGQAGSCQAVPAGGDPRGDCAKGSGAGCEGSCDGQGACAYPGADTSCGTTRCESKGADTQKVAQVCDGQGSCVDDEAQSCGGFKCDAVGGDCLTSCGEGDCVDGFTCIDASCANPQPDGSTCGTNDNACASGQCVDGICCATACDGKCERCDLSGSEGTCTPITSGADPDTECGGDPGCAGSCNGAGGCAFPGGETECGRKCIDQSGVPAVAINTCEGTGKCSSIPAVQSCDFGKCVPASKPQCVDGCANHNGCIDGSVCDRTAAHAHPKGGGQCIDPAKVTTVGTTTSIGAAVVNIGTKTHVRIAAGSYNEQLTINGTKKVTLIADGVVQLKPSADGPAISISGGAQVSVQGLTVLGATGGGDGITCNGTSQPKLTVVESIIESNQGQGIESYKCDVTLRRNTVKANQGGGLSLGNGKFTVVNNAVVQNGQTGVAGSTVGGIKLGAASSPVVSNNTVADNAVQNAGIAGIICDTGAITVANSIVWGNNSSAQYSLCAFENSTVQGGVGGPGNKDTDPSFDASYKPQAASCIDAGNSSAAGLGSIDIAGKPRKQGAAVDMGAFEVK